MNAASWERSWVVLYSEGRNVRPVPLYKQRKQGQFVPPRWLLLLHLHEPPPLPPSSRSRESSAPPPIATSITNAVDLPHHLRHGPESRQGEGREVGQGAAARGAVEGAGNLPPLAWREGAEGLLLPLLVDGDASASAYEGTPSCRFGTGSEWIPFLRAVLLLRALPAFL